MDKTKRNVVVCKINNDHRPEIKNELPVLMDNEAIFLKSGFLLKWLLKKWKLRWCTLDEDSLTCCHKNTQTVIGTIPLQGASVVCLEKDELDIGVERVLKINLSNGEEILFQGAGNQDRDRWAHAIGAVIRSLSASSQVSSSTVKFQHFRMKASVSEVLGALQDPDAGVDMASHVRNGIVHKNCFKGSDIIQWLLRWNMVQKRSDGVAMAQSLLKLGHLQEVDISDGTAGIMQSFKDDEKLYRFTSLNLGTARNSYFDSSDDSDDSLSDAEDDPKVQEKVKKGKVVRAGFLYKKKSMRKGWRIVRVLLRDNPTSLEYQCPYLNPVVDYKRATKFSKCLDLQTCYLCESSRSSNAIGDEKCVTASPKLRIYLRSKVAGKCYTFQTKNEEEWFDFMCQLQTLCKGKPSLGKSRTTDKATTADNSGKSHTTDKVMTKDNSVKSLTTDKVMTKDNSVKSLTTDKVMTKDNSGKSRTDKVMTKDNSVKSLTTDKVMTKDNSVKSLTTDKVMTKDNSGKSLTTDKVMTKDNSVKSLTTDKVMTKDNSVKSLTTDKVMTKDNSVKSLTTDKVMTKDNSVKSLTTDKVMTKDNSVTSLTTDKVMKKDKTVSSTDGQK